MPHRQAALLHVSREELDLESISYSIFHYELTSA